jgi:hypothetical protein
VRYEPPKVRHVNYKAPDVRHVDYKAPKAHHVEYNAPRVEAMHVVHADAKPAKAPEGKDEAKAAKGPKH